MLVYQHFCLFGHFLIFFPILSSAKQHSSVGSVSDLRTGVTGLIPSSANAYMGNQPVSWKEYAWLKEFQESMDMYTGRQNISEILLKMPLNTI